MKRSVGAMPGVVHQARAGAGQDEAGLPDRHPRRRRVMFDCGMHMGYRTTVASRTEAARHALASRSLAITAPSSHISI